MNFYGIYKKALQYFGAGLPSMKRPCAKLTSPIGTVKFCTLIAVQHLELKAGKKINEAIKSARIQLQGLSGQQAINSLQV